MTETQYQIVLNLYHEFNDAFNELSDRTKRAFYAKLYQ